MKTIHLPLLAMLSLAIISCGKDDITVIDTPEGSSSATETQLDSITFARTVTVTYNGTSATVDGTGDQVTHTVSGAGVTITNSGSENVKYILTGTATNGYFKLYGKKQQAICLNGVNLTNTAGAAINVQNGTTYLVIEGTNTLADGSTYTATPTDEDEKAALFSEDQLILQGNGSLTVNATGKSAIASDDYLHFTGSPVITAKSTAGHGVKANDYIVISSGTLDITATASMKKGISTDGYLTIEGGTTTIAVSGNAAYDSDDATYSGAAGIKADGDINIAAGTLTITSTGTGGKGISTDANLYIAGGTLSVSATGSNYGNSGGGHGPGGGGSSSNSVSSKGIKADGNISITGGDITVSSKNHEAIEAKGTFDISSGVLYATSQSDDAINAGSHLTVSGGYVMGYSTGNDGIDANGNLYIKGGFTYAISTKGNPEVAIDANTEGGYKLYVQGGVLVAVGGLERGSSLSQPCYQASSYSSSTTYGLTVGSDSYAFKTPSGGSSMVVSGGSTMPTLVKSPSVSGGTSHFGGMLTANATISGGTSVGLNSYSGGGYGH